MTDENESTRVGTFRANVDGKVRNLKKLKKQINKSKFFEAEMTDADKIEVRRVEPETDVSKARCSCGFPQH